MRFVWNRVKDDVAPWWKENSKECYSSAFRDLAQAFKNHFDSRDEKRKGPYSGWPKYKTRRGHQSVSFSTGAIRINDRHHIQLPTIGLLRVKESTDKLRLKLVSGTARILRATLVNEATKVFISFSVESKRDVPAMTSKDVCGHDIGITKLITSSDGSVAENPKAANQVQKKISRYQRRMDRQHRVASPKCYSSDGAHIAGICYWKKRSKRARENQTRLNKSYAKAGRIRKDVIHKTSYKAATTHGVNIVEDLRVEQMGRKGRGKRGFNRAMYDATLAEFRREMAYKCPWYGSTLWLGAFWYASSKTCSKCKTKKKKLSRSTRIFHCVSCGLEIDRDLNAAYNLAALAELATVCTVAQILTGTLLNWSKLPIKPYGWEPDKSTRSSRGCARAGGRKVDGEERKSAHAGKEDRFLGSQQKRGLLL